MSRPAEGKLGAALAALGKALDASGAAWMCIGGIASIAQGVRRTTTDIDATFRAKGVDLDLLLRRFARNGIRPRLPDAAAFARRSQVIIYKLFAGRPQDFKDTEALLFMHHASIPRSRPRDARAPRGEGRRARHLPSARRHRSRAST